MRKLILFIAISSILVCCSSKNERAVVLFNDITFKLNDGEEKINIDSKKKEIFNSHSEKAFIQIPIFRCIKADNYLIYIGLPINTSIKELVNYNLANMKNQSLESDSLNYFYTSFQNNTDYITKYSMVIDNNLIYILTVSNSSELSDSLFNKDLLSKRFNK